MYWPSDRKQRAVNVFQRRFANPIRSRLPRQALLETTGRISGLPRITPIGGRLIGESFWLVSEFGDRSQYVRNIMVNNIVRLRLRGTWHDGKAVLMPEQDPLELLAPRQPLRHGNILCRRSAKQGDDFLAAKLFGGAFASPQTLRVERIVAPRYLAGKRRPRDGLEQWMPGCMRRFLISGQ